MFSTRPVHLPTEGRMTTKTPGRENVVHRGAMTVHGKGKHNTLAPVQPHSVQPQRTKDAFLKNPTRLGTARPLGDKTPFPNRDAASSKFITPLPGAQKIAKLVLLEANSQPDSSASKLLLHPGTTPDSVARPSSTRKHVRAPRSASKQFETPVTTGNHWDVSELDLVVPPAVEPPAPTPPTDDYEEIEYMPPNSLDTPYTPPFEFSLPNYAAVGASLLRLAHSYPPDDDNAPPFELDADAAAYSCPMPVFEYSELQSDDPFAEIAPKPAVVAARSGVARPGAGRLTAPAARNATSGKAAVKKPVVSAPTRKPLLSTANKLPAARKPLASASNKPPPLVARRSSRATASAPASVLQKPAHAAPNKPPPATRKPLPAPRKLLPAPAASRKPPTASAAASRALNSRRPLLSNNSKTTTAVGFVPLALSAEPVGEEFLFDV